MADEAKVYATAHDLIHSYLGPDYKIIDIDAFYCALVQALKEAREGTGQSHRQRADLR